MRPPQPPPHPPPVPRLVLPRPRPGAPVVDAQQQLPSRPPARTKRKDADRQRSSPSQQLTRYLPGTAECGERWNALKPYGEVEAVAPHTTNLKPGFWGNRFPTRSGTPESVKRPWWDWQRTLSENFALCAAGSAGASTIDARLGGWAGMSTNVVTALVDTGAFASFVDSRNLSPEALAQADSLQRIGVSLADGSTVRTMGTLEISVALGRST